MKSAFIGVVLLLGVAANGQNTTSPDANVDIVEQLMPNGIPIRAIALTASQKADAVERLSASQVQASGKRAQQIAFLLSILGSESTKNHDYLVGVLQGCGSRPIVNDCDEDTAAFVIGLYERGDAKLLPALLKAGLNSDGALAETLGSFYSDVLTHNPTRFLYGIQQFSGSNQGALCYLAGTGDGGGMSSDALGKARTKLKGIGSKLALQCLRRIEEANKPR